MVSPGVDSVDRLAGDENHVPTTVHSSAAGGDAIKNPAPLPARVAKDLKPYLRFFSYLAGFALKRSMARFLEK